MDTPALPDALDEVSDDFARTLFDAHPEFRDLATTRPRQDDLGAWMELNIPAPSGVSELLISTEGEEVVVAFAGFDQRYNWPPWAEDDPADGPLTLIAGILDERVVIASAFADETWLGSWATSPNEPVRREDYALMGAEAIRIKSWLGTYDAEDVVAVG